MCKGWREGGGGREETRRGGGRRGKGVLGGVWSDRGKRQGDGRGGRG